jgi:hypothetical protein
MEIQHHEDRLEVIKKMLEFDTQTRNNRYFLEIVCDVTIENMLS